MELLTFGQAVEWEINWTLSICFFVNLTAPEPDVSSDSSEMVKAIIQTVQNQDKVLKDLYTHLR